VAEQYVDPSGSFDTFFQRLRGVMTADGAGDLLDRFIDTAEIRNELSRLHLALKVTAPA
jgi:hypothetical protein